MHGKNRREFLETTAALAAAAPLALSVSAAEPPKKQGAPPDEFAALDALGQAELIRRKEVTPLELVKAAIARVEKLNPVLNAVITNTFEPALARATEPVGAGPFAGVPFLVKDLEPLKGVRLTYGSRFFKSYMATYSIEVLRRMQQAGLIVIGKTNTPEFGLLPVTEPAAFGPTNNPWNLAHSPGGSSGGAAAAVAAGLVAIASASDGGGSIRIPSSCCGVFGLKISRGRNPEAPDTEPDGLSVVNCISRSVRDSAALLDATRGPTPGERWFAPPPARPYSEEIAAPPKKLRIAFRLTDFGGKKVHPDCAAAVESTVKLCEELGHTVEEAAPRFDSKAFGEAFMVLWASVAGRAIKSVKKVFPGKLRDDAFEPWTWKLFEIDSQHTPADATLAWTGPLQAANVDIMRFLTKYDVLLTPVLSRPPLKTGELDQTKPVADVIAFLESYCPFTPLANATGQPAMSVPLYWNADGLPIGSQFIGRPGDEATLLRLAAQLEQARPWANRWPTIPLAESAGKKTS